ncbi:MAG: hypothetical protein WBB64_13500, partial [Anaerolineales bacterium]
MNKKSARIIREKIRSIFPDSKSKVISVVVGVSTGAIIYLGLLQRHFFSWRYLFYFLLISSIAIFLVTWLNKIFLFQRLLSLSNNQKCFLFAFTLFLTGILLLNVEIQPLYYILPDRPLEIDFQIADLPPDEEGVRLLWVETGQGYVHYTKMDIEGEWERVFGNTVFPPGQPVRITWQGKVGKTTNIAFRSTNFNQKVDIIWDGIKTTYQLHNPDSHNTEIKQYFQIPLIHQLPFILTFGIAVSYLLILLIVSLANWTPGKKLGKKGSKKHSWLLFMLPMLIVWGFSLLVFWPGIISNDSIFQLRQGLEGQFDDWQSAFHALLLAGLFKIWPSPAFITILQVGLLAFTVA